MLFNNSLAGFNQTLAVDRDVIIRFQRVVDVLLNEVISLAGGDQQLDPLTLRLMQRFNDRRPDRFEPRAIRVPSMSRINIFTFSIFVFCTPLSVIIP